MLNIVQDGLKNDKREKREFDKSHQSYQQQQTIVKF
jgi:hypothetical protein